MYEFDWFLVFYTVIAVVGLVVLLYLTKHGGDKK